MQTRLKRLRNRDERGAALVEFAIALPIFIALLALIFDAGLGYSASRSSSSAARSAALVASKAGESRDADYRALDALLAEFGADGETAAEIEAQVQRIVIYRSPAGSDGSVPPECTTSTPGLCNVYTGAQLANLNPADFAASSILPGGDIVCDSTAPDAAWCPLLRRNVIGDSLGVYVETTSEAAVGIGASEFKLGNRAVFSMYFQPIPIPLAPAVP